MCQAGSLTHLAFATDPERADLIAGRTAPGLDNRNRTPDQSVTISHQYSSLPVSTRTVRSGGSLGIVADRGRWWTEAFHRELPSIGKGRGVFCDCLCQHARCKWRVHQTDDVLRETGNPVGKDMVAGPACHSRSGARLAAGFSWPDAAGSSVFLAASRRQMAAGALRLQRTDPCGPGSPLARSSARFPPSRSQD